MKSRDLARACRQRRDEAWTTVGCMKQAAGVDRIDSRAAAFLEGYTEALRHVMDYAQYGRFPRYTCLANGIEVTIPYTPPDPPDVNSFCKMCGARLADGTFVGPEGKRRCSKCDTPIR